MSLQIFRPRRRPLGPLLADLRDFAGVFLALAALLAVRALLKHLGVHL